MKLRGLTAGDRLSALALDFASIVPPLRRPGGISVLCYHRVYDGREQSQGDRFAVSTGMLESHLAMVLGTGHPVVPLPELERSPAGSVLFTFDDNLVSHVTFTLPILRAAGVTATFYLSPAEFGAPGSISHRDVQTLLRAGMFVGAHGNRHMAVAPIGAREFVVETGICRAFLEGLGMPLTWAYPGGHIGSFRDYHEQILRDQGFSIRFSTLEGMCRPASLQVQPRYVIRRFSSLRSVRAAVRGGLQLVSLGKRLLVRAQRLK